MSEPIDLVAEIKRRKRFPPRGAGGKATAPDPQQRTGTRDRGSEFALGRSSRYSLAGALGLDEPDSPDDVLDALEDRTATPPALGDEDRSRSELKTAGTADTQLGRDVIGERLHRHHELASRRPAVGEPVRGSAQLAPARARRTMLPRSASATSRLRARLSGPGVRPRRLFGMLAGAVIAATLTVTILLIAGGAATPRQPQQTVATRARTATPPFAQSLFSLTARVRRELAAEGQAAAARQAHDRAQRQARQRRERTLRRRHTLRRKRALARERAAKRRSAQHQAPSSVSTPSPDAATTASPTAATTVTVTAPPTVSSSVNSTPTPGPAGPTGVGSSSGGCDPKCG